MLLHLWTLLHLWPNVITLVTFITFVTSYYICAFNTVRARVYFPATYFLYFIARIARTPSLFFENIKKDKPESKICCCRHFFVKISRLHIVRISALRWTEFHQNRKDPIRKIQRFPNLGHNLCENDKQTFHGLYLINYRQISLFWALL